MTIDAHHHLWHYTPAEYGWIDDSMANIRRDFLPAHLAAELQAAHIDGAISVQARQTLEETRWLLQLAKTSPAIRAVVGWAPLASPDIHSHLEQLAPDPHLRALRHVLQGEPDDFMLSPDFNRGISLLPQFNLRYDLLIFERQLPAALQFVDRHPTLPIILDHIAKPRIRDAALEPWRTNIRQLAKRPHLTCKISGMVTEADLARWSPDSLKPYFDVVLDAFGPARLMFGSDWPVCLAGVTYPRWAQIVRDWIAPLSPSEQSAILGDTAARTYLLP